MARGSCCCGCCKCCLWAAQSIPQTFYQVLLTFLQIASIGLGAYLIVWGINFNGKNPAAPFVSNEFFIASMALGGFLAAVCIYGALAPLTCRGAKDDHLKVSYVLLLLALIVFIAFTLLSILNSGDAQNLNTMLDYGWQKAFSGTGKGSQNAITSAQLAGKCCGYNSPSDRPIAPCPPGAAVGCASFLQGQLKQQLGFVGMLFAAGAGACLLVMAVSHGWIERISFDRVKASSASGAGSASSANFSAYSGLDGSRAPMRGPNDPRAAQAMGLRREPVRASGSLPASMVKRGTAGMSFAGGDGAGGGLGDPNPLLGGSSSGAGSVKRR